MSLYLPVKTSGTAAIAVCLRCQKKVYYTDLVEDPNNKQRYCKECVDSYDPWRLPARRPEDITLSYPRRDVPLDGTP